MFQFSGLAFHSEHLNFIEIGFPIRKSADQIVFANPRGLSQLITSFIAFKSQGILHTPLITFLLSDILSFLNLFLFQYVKERSPFSGLCGE